MKYILGKSCKKVVLTMALIVMWGGVSVSASEPSYKIEVKNKFHSKHHRDHKWGVQYLNDEDAPSTWKDVREFPLVEGYYSFNQSSSTHKVKQYAVSKGVVYWLNPSESVLCYWNTVTGKAGSYPLYREDNVRLDMVDMVGAGSITQDWAGNLIFAYYTKQNQAVQGFATIEGRNTKYGELVPNVVRLTDMSGNFSQNCAMEWIEGTYKTKPASGCVQTRHPNIPSTDINSKTSTSQGTPVYTQYLTASGDVYDMHWSSSSVYSGYSGGYVFIAYNNIVFANMFANGKYANWYLNYKVQHKPSPSSNYVTVTPNQNYISESLYRECDELEYFWSSPGVAYAEFAHPGGDFLNDGVQYDLLGNLNQYYAYNTTETQDFLPSYTLADNGQSIASTQTGYDWTVGMESDSIKGQRVLINSTWMNRVPNQSIGDPYHTFVRDGGIDIRTCSYDGGFSANEVDGDGNPRQWLGKPTRNYTKVASGYGYNNTMCTSPVPSIAVNCWNELERVNDNVFALYTHVPGQGFSKYYITAVEQENPVTLNSIDYVCYKSSMKETDPDYVKLGSLKAKLTWTAQEHDRATLNRYEIWYKTYKRDADGALVTDCGDTWKKAGVSSIDYSDKKYSENRQGVFYHELTYGGANTEDTSDDYDLTYEYMIIPFYDASDHRGSEAIFNRKLPSAAPRYPATSTLYQITEGDDDNKKYSFDLKLDLTPNANINKPYTKDGVKASVPRYWVTIDADTDEERAALGKALYDATDLYAVDENGNKLTDVTITVNYNKENPNATYDVTANNCHHYAVKGYNVFFNHEKYRVNSIADKFPSLVWKNVDPQLKYKVKVVCQGVLEANFIPSQSVETEMTIPTPIWSLPKAEFHRLNGNYGDLTGDGENQPLGAYRLINNSGDHELSNRVTFENANYYGTKDGTIKPIRVTDNVLGVKNSEGRYINNDWKIDYTLYVYDENGVKIREVQFNSQEHDANAAAYYSNEKDVVCDVVGLPVEYITETAEDGRQRKIYYPNQREYTTKLVVEYMRVSDNLSVVKEVDGTLILGTTTLDPLNLETAQEIQGSLFIPKRVITETEPHYWWNGQFDENAQEGYFSRYFDALLLLKWSDDAKLNRYMGYYAQTHDVCYGHYENASSSTWTRYAAGSVLTNEEINAFVGKYNISDLNGGAIGYDGTNNWSDLAIVNNQVPMKVHYVRGDNGNSSVSNIDIKFDITMTAEYPIIVKEGLDGVIVAENSSTYALVGDTYMTVLTVPRKLNNAYVSNEHISTGVEGIITDACGGVTLYPNPVKNLVTLRAPMPIKNVKIFTISGQLVKIVNDCNNKTVSINVDELPNGLYIVNTLGISKLMIKQ